MDNRNKSLLPFIYLILLDETDPIIAQHYAEELSHILEIGAGYIMDAAAQIKSCIDNLDNRHYEQAMQEYIQFMDLITLYNGLADQLPDNSKSTFSRS